MSPSSEKDSDKEAQKLEGLGEALAGVTIGSNEGSATLSSGIGSSPFALAPGGTTNPTMENNDGWGNYASPSPTNQPTPSEATSNNVEADRARQNESLELFLSQSPSQTLGDEVFKFSSHTNLPALAEEEKESSSFRMPVKTMSNGFGEIRENNPRRRTESPSCSVTGTTTSSRSVSPYTAENANRINAYSQRFEPPSDPTPSLEQSSGSSLSTLVDSRSPYVKTGYAPSPSANTQPFEANQRSSPSASAPVFTPQMDQSQLSAATPAAGQVLYMAVPSPDGRGQVLQPVQMMQLPGKPYTYVVPGGGLQPPGLGNDNMMVLPPVQQQASPPLSDYGTPDLRSSQRSSQYSVDTNSIDQRGEDFGKKPSYQTDPAIASLYAAPQRPPLDALLGQVRRLSRDQVGCRLVQQALDEEGPMAATLILQEGLPFWGEAMVDPFGNYLFQKILEKVAPEERVMLVKNVSTRLVNASLNLHGTRSVQKIVEVCAQDEQDGFNPEESAATILTASLAPAAARLCIDSHGNHVIQRILLRLSAKHSKFVFDAVAASVGDVARHRHGCCVIQRCLDSPHSDSRANLVHRIVEKCLELMQDAYGNYVVQYVLDVCADKDVHAVCESVVGKVNLLAIQKFSSNVMEKCLERCTDRVKELYLHEISDPERIRELMMDPFGNYVVQRALSVAAHAQAIRLVEAMRPHLIATQTGGPNGQRNGGVRNTAGGRRIIAKICRRFPNFTLNPVGTQEELYSQNKGNHHHHHHQPYRYLNHHQQGNHHAQQPPKQQQSYYHHAPVGAPGLQHYGHDPRMAPQPMGGMPQAPQHYGGGATDSYYDAFGGGGQNGYHGM